MLSDPLLRSQMLSMLWIILSHWGAPHRHRNQIGPGSAKYHVVRMKMRVGLARHLAHTGGYTQHALTLRALYPLLAVFNCTSELQGSGSLCHVERPPVIDYNSLTAIITAEWLAVLNKIT